MPPLAPQLAHLEANGLIYAAVHLADYTFRHALIQDAAYSSLLKADRRVLHQHTGEVLLALYPSRETELAPILAKHFAQAGQTARAIHYYTLAAVAASRVHANAEAAQFYNDALQLVTGPNQSALQLRLGLGRGRALELSGQHPAALAGYIELETQAQAADDQVLALAFILAQATLRATYTPVADFALGQTLAEKALGLAQALGDKAAEAKAYWNLLLAHRSAAQVLPAIAAGERGLALARQEGLVELQAFLLTDLAAVYLFSNQLAKAKASIEEAVPLWEQLDNPAMLTDAYSRQATLARRLGRPHEALAIAQKSLQLSRQIFNAWGEVFSQMTLALVWLDLGHLETAWTTQQTAVALSREQKLPFPPLMLLPMAAKVCYDLGAQTLVAQCLAQMRVLAVTAKPMALSLGMIEAYLAVKQGRAAEAAAFLQANATPDNDFIAQLWGHVRVEVALAQGQPTDALALAAAQAQHALPYALVATLHLVGRALLALGRTTEAEAQWQAAAKLGEAHDLRLYTWQVLADLSDLAQTQQRVNDANAYLARARVGLTYILDHSAPEIQAEIRQTTLAQKVLERVS